MVHMYLEMSVQYLTLVVVMHAFVVDSNQNMVAYFQILVAASLSFVSSLYEVLPFCVDGRD